MPITQTLRLVPRSVKEPNDPYKQPQYVPPKEDIKESPPYLAESKPLPTPDK
jgi:hypothetical protein